MKKNNFLLYIPASERKRYENEVEKRPVQATYKPDSYSTRKFERPNVKGLTISFNDPVASFILEDNKANELKRRRDLNGDTDRTAIMAYSQFTGNELRNKMKFMMMIGNSEKNKSQVSLEKASYDKGYSKRIASGDASAMGELAGSEEQIRVLKAYRQPLPTEGDIKNMADKPITKNVSKYHENIVNLYDNYEILEEHTDEKTGMTAYVLGEKNKPAGERGVEIFYSGSINFNPADPNSMKDWGNNAASSVMVPGNYEAALRFADQVNARYSNGYKGYNKGVVGVNGHSKGGGEAMYVGSKRGFKTLLIDPAILVDPGKYVDSGKILSIQSGNGNSSLNKVERSLGSDFYTLKQKAGVSEGKGVKKTSTITALPVPSSDRGKGVFKDHFPDIEASVEQFEKMKEYAMEVQKTYYPELLKDASETKNNQEEVKYFKETGKFHALKKELNYSRNESLSDFRKKNGTPKTEDSTQIKEAKSTKENSGKTL